MRRAGAVLLTLLSALALPAAAADAAKPKVLRIAFRAAETGFDPALINDLYSRTVTPHIFEGLYTYDPLARPAKIKPLTAAAMPEVSADFRVWTIRIKPGIHFADDPAFKGRKRELVAEDYVYTFKRFFDPANKSPVYAGIAENGLLGLDELREEALKNKTPFDYDRPVEGLKALDRYTLQFRLKSPRPRFLYGLATGDLFGAVAREVIEHYPGETMAHPVGTGPFVLKQWRRSSLIVLERNPQFREMVYDAEPNADDADGQATLARFKGRRLPMIDRVEVSIIEEPQPRWLAFLNDELDAVELPEDFANQAIPNGKLAPNLARRGITQHSIVYADVRMTMFNMEDPVIGGYTPDKVALRRAISLGFDLDREIRLVRRQQAIKAQAGLMPHTYGYDPQLRSTNSEYDPARAKALLDLYGYVDKDGDGWRDQPDGSPLVLEFSTQSDQLSRQLDETWQHGMNAIGVRMTLRTRQWPENLKAARSGKLMLWMVGLSAASPDGQPSFQRLYGPAAGGQNLARFKLDRFDELYRRSNEMADGPERLALMNEMSKLNTAYMPYKYHVHRIYTDLLQPRLVGYKRPLFWQELWHYVDIDERPLPAR
ncbi:ABC transporter substrate-binding protein [uncultured Methylibium sp.]|uniref:ABC transporter substrate-binding protein n=1 Tax=uncultured Methylibium sp. TaxID=381093 RepID=UPI0025F92E81|nr:ABC transporter substrate-binding protein [uncultured Methylibium sp.]